MKEMVGGCCVCSDDRGWTENPLVYCDGPGCTVAVHQACYGIVTVPVGNWYCRKCESADRNMKVKCELCPNKDGALKPTDNNAWAHVVCALYIPEVRFGNVSTMEPIILEQIPPERYHKTCYLCEENSRGSVRASVGACMSCNKPGCKAQFHVTCAQSRGLLCEEAGNYMDNVKYCGYCHHHYTKIVIKKKGVNVKVIPPYKPVTVGSASPESESMKSSKRKLSTSSTKSSTGKTSTTSNVSPAVEEGPNADESAPSGAPDGPPQPPESPVLPATDVKRKRKGETRTPPATGLTPDSSPRPITPSGASTSTAGSSTGQHVPTPSSSPSLGSSGGPSQNPGPSSAASPSEAKRPSLQGVLKDNQRPNSIVVNVPLDVATSVANIPALQPSVNLGVPTTLGITGTTTLPQVDLASSSSLLSGGNSQSSASPLRRSRSQSSEKTDKPRRSSKRSSGPGTNSGNKPLPGSSPTPPTNVINSNKTDGAGGSHLANHLGGEPSHSGAGKARRHSQSHSSGHVSNHASGHSGHGSGHSSGHASGHSGHGSGHSSGHASGHSSGHASGHSSGHASGHSSGHAAGHSSGHASGHSSGHASGHASGHSSGHATNHISHTSTNHLSHQQPGGSASTTPAGAPPMNHLHVVPSPSPPQIKDEKTDIKLLPNVETVQVPHMLGNRLNPSSTMAQKMCDTLSEEMVAHSVFNANTSTSNHPIGPQVPGRGSSSSSGTTSNQTPSGGGGWGGSSSVPQSLEQLLERQWEQGSQFLMEQAQHFDIASLLTCLHQLRAENSTLEEQVNQLVQRRDHLLAVNARLAIPLVPPVTTTSSTINSQNGNPSVSQPVPGQPSGPIVENGLPSSSPQDVAAFRSSTIRQNSSNPSNISGISNLSSAQNSVLVRTSAADSRRSSHSPASNVYNPNQMFQQNQQQVVMRRDVIEMNQSGSSKAS